MVVDAVVVILRFGGNHGRQGVRDAISIEHGHHFLKPTLVAAILVVFVLKVERQPILILLFLESAEGGGLPG